MEKKKNAVHNGHRERMRERVEKAGAQCLADHELLEMLLYYIQPRRDTNETAHELIEECGSLSAVLEAPAERLCRVPYIKEHAALYLQLLGELSRRYATAKFEQKDAPLQGVYDTEEKLVSLIFPRFLGQKSERMYALLFDSAMHVQDIFCVGEGSINAVSVTLRRITERAYQRNAASVVLAHNHPGGVAHPSEEDLHLTRDMQTALGLVGVPLLEHFIFTDHEYYPILSGLGSTEGHMSAAAAARGVIRRKN